MFNSEFEIKQEIKRKEVDKCYAQRQLQQLSKKAHVSVHSVVKQRINMLENSLVRLRKDLQDFQKENTENGVAK